MRGSGGAVAAMSPARVRLTPAPRRGTIFLEARCASSDVRLRCPFLPSETLVAGVEWSTVLCLPVLTAAMLR